MTNDRVALDIGLMTLTVKLNLNETFLIQALLNATKRTELCLKIGLGQGPAEAEFFVAPGSVLEKVVTP